MNEQQAKCLVDIFEIDIAMQCEGVELKKHNPELYDAYEALLQLADGDLITQEQPPIKVTVWAIANNNGDGSGAVSVYATEQDGLEAENLEGLDEGFTDSLTKLELEFDHNGLLLNPDTIVRWADA